MDPVTATAGATVATNIANAVFGGNMNYKNRKYGREMFENQRQHDLASWDFNSNEALKAREHSTSERLGAQGYETSERLAVQDWNSPANQAKLLSEAGYSPHLALSGSSPFSASSAGSSSGGSSSSASGSASASPYEGRGQAPKVTLDAMQLALLNAQRENIDADTDSKRADAENKRAGAENYGANTAATLLETDFKRETNGIRKSIMQGDLHKAHQEARYLSSQIALNKELGLSEQSRRALNTATAQKMMADVLIAREQLQINWMNARTSHDDMNTRRLEHNRLERRQTFDKASKAFDQYLEQLGISADDRHGILGALGWAAQNNPLLLKPFRSVLGDSDTNPMVGGAILPEY